MQSCIRFEWLEVSEHHRHLVRPRWESRESVTSGAVGTRGPRSDPRVSLATVTVAPASAPPAAFRTIPLRTPGLARLRHDLRRLQQCREEQCRQNSSHQQCHLVWSVEYAITAAFARSLIRKLRGQASFVSDLGTLAPLHPGTLAPLALWHPWHFGTLGTLPRERYHCRNVREETFCTKTEDISSR